jgi:hypothetical protein
MLYDALIAPFLRIRIHAPRAGRRGRARARRRADRRVPDAAADEPVGDAMAHAILPGAAIGFLFSGSICSR